LAYISYNISSLFLVFGVKRRLFVGRPSFLSLRRPLCSDLAVYRRMAARAALARLRKELRSFEPPPYIRAAPLEQNLQEWRFVLQGPPDSPYEGGMYQGKVKFPDEYPFKPPSIYMLTPNGRFETDRRLCLSISDFHPETWVPTWSVASIINGVLSFMLEEAPTTGARKWQTRPFAHGILPPFTLHLLFSTARASLLAAGSIQTTTAEKHRLRDASVAFNAKDAVFCQLFPELVEGAPFYEEASAPDSSLGDKELGVEAAAAGIAALPVALGCAETEEGCGPPAEVEPGTGKNAAKNKKKREKEKAKKAIAATQGAVSSSALTEEEMTQQPAPGAGAALQHS
jgi:ubiquitin-conjugating enzyme E2 J2